MRNLEVRVKDNKIYVNEKEIYASTDDWKIGKVVYNENYIAWVEKIYEIYVRDYVDIKVLNRKTGEIKTVAGWRDGPEAFFNAEERYLDELKLFGNKLLVGYHFYERDDFGNYDFKSEINLKNHFKR